ncbi:AMP-binding protein [Shewanella donghaensis]|uniref:AMP-binding protein n=1 Tax=Shewanella donghaensis TaxID=238836 RepID=UPI001182BA2C|nr:AMP-binding protein [Shewanella donghaensis]
MYFDRPNVLLKVSVVNQFVINFCLMLIAQGKNLILIDKCAKHIDINRSAIDFKLTTIITDEDLANFESGLTYRLSSTINNKQCVMLFTSGSTGAAKCIKLDPVKINESAIEFCHWFDIDTRSTILSLAPLPTMSGVRSLLYLPSISGCSISFSGQDNCSVFDYINIIETEAISHVIVGPPFVKMLALIAPRISIEQVKSLKYILCTGANLNCDDVKKIGQYLSVKVLNYYGLTETYGFCIAQQISANSSSQNNIGVEVNGVEAVIKEPNLSGVGRLYIKSERLFAGYLGCDEMTLSELETGDLAYKNELGEIVLSGRADDGILLSSTELVYPHDLVIILLSVDYIYDAHVIKTPDGWHARLVTSLTKLDLVSSMKNDLETKYIPVNFAIVDKIERTSLGKLPVAAFKD